MSDGIYYSTKDSFVLVDSEGCTPEDRGFFTHIEFWWQGKLLLKVPIGTYTHRMLLDMSNDPDWAETLHCC